MKAVLYSTEQRAVHIEPLEEFISWEKACIRRGDPSHWRIVGVGSDDEVREVAREWQHRRNGLEKIVEVLRAKRQAEAAA